MAGLAATTLASSGLMTIGLLVAGKALGPADFGRYSVAYSLASVLALPAGYGIGAATMKAWAEAQTTRSPNHQLRIGYMAFCVTAFGSTCILLLLARAASLVLGLELEVFQAGVLFGLPLSLYLFSEYILKGRSQIAGLIAVRTITGIAFLGLLWFLLRETSTSFVVPLLSRGVPYIVIGLLIVLSTWPRRQMWLSHSSHGLGSTTGQPVRDFFAYTVSATLASAASTFLLFADKVVLVRVLTPRDVGIYSAYFLGSYFLLSRIGEVLIGIYFPIAVRSDRGAMASRLDAVLLPAGAVAFVATIGAEFASLRILGPEFPFSWSLAVMFAAGVSMYVAADIRWWLISASGSETDVRSFGKASILVSGLVVAGMMSLPRLAGLHGAAAAILLGSAVSLTLSKRASRRALFSGEVG